MELCWYRTYIFVTFTDTIFMSVCLQAYTYFTAVHFAPVYVYTGYIQMGLECIAGVNQMQATHKSSQGLCETGQKRTESIYSNKS